MADVFGKNLNTTSNLESNFDQCVCKRCSFDIQTIKQNVLDTNAGKRLYKSATDVELTLVLKK
jgi:hypothetical protein